MGINEAKIFCDGVLAKDQRGGISPSDFNAFATIAQIEAISDRLTNVKKIDNRLLPQYGYKANRKIITELRLLLVGPIQMTVNSHMLTTYPADYFYPDSMHTPDYKHIEMIESDEYPHIKQSLIFPPDEEHPHAVFYGDYILVDPDGIQVMFSYIKYPPDPVWAYTGTTNPIYDPGNSVDLLGDRSFGIDVCRRILKYAGVNLGSDMVSQFAKSEELSN